MFSTIWFNSSGLGIHRDGGTALTRGFMNCAIYMRSCQRSRCSRLAAATETKSDPASYWFFENVTSSLVGYTQACQTQINIGQGSAFINLGNTPGFVTQFSFNWMMLMRRIDFDFVCIWAKSQGAPCSFPPRPLLLVCPVRLYRAVKGSR